MLAHTVLDRTAPSLDDPRYTRGLAGDDDSADGDTALDRWQALVAQAAPSLLDDVDDLPRTSAPPRTDHQNLSPTTSADFMGPDHNRDVVVHGDDANVADPWITTDARDGQQQRPHWSRLIRRVGVTIGADRPTTTETVELSTPREHVGHTSERRTARRDSIPPATLPPDLDEHPVRPSRAEPAWSGRSTRTSPIGAMPSASHPRETAASRAWQHSLVGLWRRRELPRSSDAHAARSQTAHAAEPSNHPMPEQRRAPAIERTVRWQQASQRTTLDPGAQRHTVVEPSHERERQSRADAAMSRPLPRRQTAPPTSIRLGAIQIGSITSAARAEAFPPRPVPDAAAVEWPQLPPSPLDDDDATSRLPGRVPAAAAGPDAFTARWTAEQEAS